MNNFRSFFHLQIFFFIILFSSTLTQCDYYADGHYFNFNPLRNPQANYHVAGARYEFNFTLNLCGPLVETKETFLCGSDCAGCAVNPYGTHVCLGQVFGAEFRYQSTTQSSLLFTNGEDGFSFSLEMICDPNIGFSKPQFIQRLGASWQFVWATAYACSNNCVQHADCKACAADLSCSWCANQMHRNACLSAASADVVCESYLTRNDAGCECLSYDQCEQCNDPEIDSCKWCQDSKVCVPTFGGKCSMFSQNCTI